MDAQLVQVQRELEDARRSFGELVDRLPAGGWEKRPALGGWSISQCAMHLNTTSEEFLPRLDAAIRAGREKNLVGSGPFRRDFMGWMLCKMVEPPYRMKVKTPAKFDPQDASPADKVMAEWDRLNGELFRRIEAADGLALNKVRVVSPFAEKMKYNLLSAWMVIPAHQRRHLWQAEQICSRLGRS